MAQIDIEALNSEIKEIKKKYYMGFRKPKEVKDFISDAEKILGKYPDPEEEAREILGKFYSYLGSKLVVYGNDREAVRKDGENLERGISYYHKATELCPGSYDIRWNFYTTLEELIENEKRRTPELIQIAIDCLQFCIDYCDTPELMEENRIQYRYFELAKVYLIANQPEKAAECARKSLEIEEDKETRELLEEIESRL